MSDKVNITFESLFDLFRNEKARPQLEKLNDTFYEDVVEYLKDKETMLQKDDDVLFSAEDKEKTSKQLQNIKRILKNLYELREKKIINLALIKSRTGTNIIDFSVLLPEERQFFDSAVKNFDNFRTGILSNLLVSKLPSIIETNDEPTKPKSNNKMVRFTEPVPKFVGRDLEVYGPYQEEDMANLPNEIADLLISKDKAEEIKES